MNRILLVSPVSPFDEKSGASQRSALMLKALEGLAKVDVLCLRPGTETNLVLHAVEGARFIEASLSGADGILWRFSPKIEFTKQLEALLGHPLGGFDLIVGRYAWGLCQLDIPSSVRTLVDLDDYRFRFSRLYERSPANVAERLRKWLGHALAKRNLRRFTGAFVASMRDFDEISASSQLPACFLPNVAPAIPPASSMLPVDGQVLFVGSLWYGPNVQGVGWFLRHVWPSVRVRFPKARFLLVGAASQEARSRWESIDGVRAPGFVDDLSATYAESMVAVVPIQSGGGSNIKVLEALRLGRPCVVSSFVASAFSPHLQPGVHFRTAETAPRFVEEICEILGGTNVEIEATRRQRGYEAVAEHFCPDSFVVTVRAFVGQVEVATQAAEATS
ncbi:glycosyltransferase [Hydrogenophaga sp.]|uniref:glycosyltransferase n=1 Tax=Hydrogenophaga sp. TaxID=1904254 RepID=UPI00271F9551|nr:glycosyltransferase [Hydrogenophaga sp.]MDO9504990.1 glycosyltransferase [Hydrogenophaga sp.]